jgi:hypothetical protein
MKTLLTLSLLLALCSPALAQSNLVGQFVVSSARDHQYSAGVGYVFVRPNIAGLHLSLSVGLLAAMVAHENCAVKCGEDRNGYSTRITPNFAAGFKILPNTSLILSTEWRPIKANSQPNELSKWTSGFSRMSLGLQVKL